MITAQDLEYLLDKGRVYGLTDIQMADGKAEMTYRFTKTKEQTAAPPSSDCKL